jgi:hypothetical protein
VGANRALGTVLVGGDPALAMHRQARAAPSLVVRRFVGTVRAVEHHLRCQVWVYSTRCVWTTPPRQTNHQRAVPAQVLSIVVANAVERPTATLATFFQGVVHIFAFANMMKTLVGRPDSSSAAHKIIILVWEKAHPGARAVIIRQATKALQFFVGAYAAMLRTVPCVMVTPPQELAVLQTQSSWGAFAATFAGAAPAMSRIGMLSVTRAVAAALEQPFVGASAAMSRIGILFVMRPLATAVTTTRFLAGDSVARKLGLSILLGKPA